jgi:serine/threonine protein kinase
MEYLDLGDLHRYLMNRKEPLPEEQVQAITFQLLEGIDIMHDNEFAHRDLKPQVTYPPLVLVSD